MRQKFSLGGLRMLIHQIGETAGQIWQALDHGGPARLSALKKEVGAADAILHMALGWLAREGKVEIEAEGRGYRVQLK